MSNALSKSHPAANASTWVLVAGRARARLLELVAEDNGPALSEIEDFLNPDGRGPMSDQVSERLPRTRESVGSARHAIEPHTSLRDKSVNRFVRDLSDSLEKARLAHSFDRLVVVALPRLLGTLRATLNQRVRECIVAEVPHDLTTKGPTEILNALPKPLLS